MDVNAYHLELIFTLINFYQQQKLMKKDILTEILFLSKKDKKHQKKTCCKFIRINISNAKNGYDLDDAVGNIEAFIDEFKDRQLEKERLEKKSNKKIKELAAKIKELEDKNNNATTKQITK